MWYCSECGDGQMASWFPGCVNCGHIRCSSCSANETGQPKPDIRNVDEPELPIAQIPATISKIDIESEAVNDSDDGQFQPNVEVFARGGNIDATQEEGTNGIDNGAASMNGDEALTSTGRATRLFENILVFAGILEPPLLPGMTRLRWKCVSLV